MLSLVAGLLLAATDLPTFAPADLRSDFQGFRKTLQDFHPGIYRYTPKEDMDRAFDRAERTLSQPMNVLEFQRVIAPLEALMHCGHSGVNPPADLVTALGAQSLQLPLKFRVLNGSLYVAAVYDQPPALLGKEVLTINGKKSSDILKTMDLAMGHDGTVKSSTPYRLSNGRGFNRNLITLCDIRPPFQLTLAGLVGPTDIASGITDAELVAKQEKLSPARKDTEPNGTIEFREGIPIIKIYGFQGELAAFYNDAFAQVEKSAAKSLILDVRGNGGGEDELGRRLYAHMAPGPFTYYRDLLMNSDHYEYVDGESFKAPEGFLKKDNGGLFHAVGHPNWGTQQPLTPTFHGKVFVLMDGGSFSTTGEFLSTMKEHKRATFIGEESGAGLQGNNSGPGRTVTLPKTKVRFSCPLLRYQMNVTSTSTRGILPDVPVTYSIEEILAKKDKTMEIALKMAKG